MPKKFEKFRGMNNVDSDTELSTREFRVAQNVDLTNRGIFRRRGGYSLVTAGDFHSLWSDSYGCYVVYNNALCSVGADFSLTVVRSNLRPNERMTYARVANDVYYSNGFVTGVIKNGVDRPWGVEVPTSPALTSIDGSMPAGVYQVKLTFIDDLGAESGSSVSSSITVTDGSGVRVSLPDAIDATVEGVGVYITPQNGETFYYVSTAPIAASSMDIVGGKYAYPLRTEFLQPPLPGRIIGSRNGRIYYIAEGVLWYTEAYGYGLVRPSTNYVQLPNEVNDGVVTKGGMYVSDGATHFISGDPGSMQDSIVSDAGIITGTAKTVPASVFGEDIQGSGDVAVWASSYGLMLGGDNGEAIELTRRRVSFPVGEYGATQLIESEGINRILTSLKDPDDEVSNVAMGDRVIAEVRRNGVVIN